MRQMSCEKHLQIPVQVHVLFSNIDYYFWCKIDFPSFLISRCIRKLLRKWPIRNTNCNILEFYKFVKTAESENFTCSEVLIALKFMFHPMLKSNFALSNGFPTVWFATLIISKHFASIQVNGSSRIEISTIDLEKTHANR